MNYSNILLALCLAFFTFSCEDKLDEGVLDQTTYYYINSSDYPILLSVKNAFNILENRVVDSSAAPGDTIQYHSMMITGPGSPFMGYSYANDTAITVTIKFSATETRCLEFQGAITDSAVDIRHFLAYNKVPTGNNANWNSYFTITNDHFNKSGICK